MVSCNWPRQSRSKVSACRLIARSPSPDMSFDARAKSRSPVRIATELPHTFWALATPRRMFASSMTSSW